MISVSRRSGYARRGGQSPPYGKSHSRHELCKAQYANSPGCSDSGIRGIGFIPGLHCVSSGLPL